MYFESLAHQLLNVYARTQQLSVNQEIYRLLRGELFVLNYLKEHEGGVHPKELSEKLSVSTARIARILKHMEQQQLVLRYTDAHDSRQVVVQITEQGRQEITQACQKVLAHTVDMLEALGPEDAREYIRLQEKICQNYLGREARAPGKR